MKAPGTAAVSIERFFQFSLLGLVASGYLAVAGSGYLDAPTIVLTAAGLVLRALLVAGVVRLEISARAVTLVTLAYMGFFALDYLFLSRGFLEATVHLVFFLAVVKILTARTNRDYAYITVIAFLELLAAAVLSANLSFFGFLSLYLLFAMAAFTSSEIRRAVQKPQAVARSGLRRFHLRLGALTLFVTVGILSLTAGLFFMLPRTANAAFDRLISRRVFLPGFSSQVTLGEIGEVMNSSQPVMHVRAYRDQAANLKWRGAALTRFDGRKWFNPPGRDVPVPVEQGRAVLERRRPRRQALLPGGPQRHGHGRAVLRRRAAGSGDPQRGAAAHAGGQLPARAPRPPLALRRLRHARAAAAARIPRRPAGARGRSRPLPAVACARPAHRPAGATR